MMVVAVRTVVIRVRRSKHTSGNRACRKTERHIWANATGLGQRWRHHRGDTHGANRGQNCQCILLHHSLA